MYCIQCGLLVREGARFCQRCGRELKVVSETGSPKEQTLVQLHESNSDQAIPIGQPIDESRTFLGGRYHPWRRIFARTVDIFTLGLIPLLLFSLFVGYVFPASVEGYLKLLENPVTAGIYLYLLWIPVEAAFLSSFGATPAKWIFGIRVVAANGRKLRYGEAVKRTCLVWLQGEGLGIPIVAIFTRLFAYRRLTKTGTTLWDSSTGSVVEHLEWSAARAVGSVLSVFLAVMILASLNALS